MVFLGLHALRLIFFESKKTNFYTFFYELRKTSNVHSFDLGFVVQMLNSTNGL